MDNGLGDVNSDFYYVGYRDPGGSDPWAQDVVYDPKRDAACRGDAGGQGEEALRRRARIEAAVCRTKEFIKQRPWLIKKPAFLEPPYFSKPIIVVLESPTIVNSFFRTTLLTLEDRQRFVMTSFGVNVSNTALLAARQLRFGFSGSFDVQFLGEGGFRVNQAVPIFDDQTPSGATVLSSIIPGSVEKPFNLLKNGLVVQFRGPTSVVLLFQNISVQSTQVVFLITGYQYWVSKATEFDKADLQR